jgi:hypothetical protein
MPEIVFQYALLDSDLGGGIEVLHTAAATHAKMRAARRDAITGGFFDAQGPRQFIRRLPAIAGVFDTLARQGTFDKNGFPVKPGDAPAFVIQRFDDSGRHAKSRQKSRAIVAFKRWFSTINTGDTCENCYRLAIFQLLQLPPT